jgi:hypothetical protein
VTPESNLRTGQRGEKATDLPNPFCLAENGYGCAVFISESGFSIFFFEISAEKIFLKNKNSREKCVEIACVCYQGCQMVYFQTKNPNLGKFRRVLDWKMLIHFKAIWNIYRIFDIFYDHLVHFVLIWYFFRFWYHAPRKIWQPCS